MNNSDILKDFYDIDHGLVLTHNGEKWFVNREARPSDSWMDDLRAAGFSPSPFNEGQAELPAGTTVRVIPMGLKPHVFWSTEQSTHSDESLKEEIFPTLPGGTEIHNGGDMPGWAKVGGKVVKWAIPNLIWDGVKYILIS